MPKESNAIRMVWIAVLQSFGNNQASMLEAGAYIAGMATLSKILDERYLSVKPEMQ